jgi:hypothetical protein
MIAPEYGKESSGIRKFAFFNVLYPRTKGPKRNFILRFARDGARVTTDTFAVIYYKAVFHLSIDREGPIGIICPIGLFD